MSADILQTQIAYYRARAGEYDEWFYRQGRFDHGEADNAAWFAEVADVQRALHAVGPVGDALELAGGTGIWTRELVTLANHVTVLDAAPEMLARNAQNVPDPRVQRHQADLFVWEPERQYDLVFFSFWLSHVPPARLAPFLAAAVRAVRPGGRIFIVDSLPDPASSATNHPTPDPAGTLHERKLNDGSTYTIVKVFYDPTAIAAALTAQGCPAEGHTSGRFFWWVTGSRDR